MYNNTRSSRLTNNSVYKLDATNLAFLHPVQTINHACKTIRAELDRVYNDLLASEELRGQVPELLCELKVLRFGRFVDPVHVLESLAENGVAECTLGHGSAYEKYGIARLQLTLFFTSLRSCPGARRYET